MAGETVPAKYAIFRREGEFWTIGFQSRRPAHLRDRKGLRCIAVLLREPGREFFAVELGTLIEGGPIEAPAAAVSAEDPSASVVSAADLAARHAGEALDAIAKADYKRRLDELRDKVEEYQEFGDSEGVARTELEIDFLHSELARAVGRGGRDRRTSSTAERARLRITGIIRGAIEKIAAQDRVLGDFLDRRIKTGSFCSYTPDLSHPVTWLLEPGEVEVRQIESKPAATVPTEVGGRRDADGKPLFAYRTSFVGRASERAVLRSYLERAIGGQGAIVTLGGEPGIGKTRLGSEIAREALGSGVEVLVGHCYEREQAVPFLPFAEILESALARAKDSGEFRQRINSNAPELARIAPQLRRTFSDIPVPQEVAPELSRRTLLSAFTDFLMRWSRETPLMLVLDDIHDADESTLLLISHVARHVARMRVLIVATFRDLELDVSPALAQTLEELARNPAAERIHVSTLPRLAVGELLRTLSGLEPPEQLADLFFRETGGNPFFIEELFSHLRERGRLFDANGQFNQRIETIEGDVPEGVRLVIGRRLERLQPRTRIALNSGAIIGRALSLSLWQAVTDFEGDDLVDCVEEAERAGLIHSRSVGTEERFTFTHELIRQGVLGLISLNRRRHIHLAVAGAIERLFAGRLEDHASDLAHHLLAAGGLADAAKTVGYLEMAARRKCEQSAYDDALRDVQNALELLKRLPDSQDRGRLELELLFDYGVAILATKGWYVPEYGNAYARARQLCEGRGDDLRLFRVLFGLSSFHLVRAEHRVSRSFAEEMIKLAPRLHDDGMLVVASWVLGVTQFFMGDLTGAHASFQQGIQKYDRQRHRNLALLFGQDLCMSCLCYDAMTLWMLGYPEQAGQRAQESLALARELGYPFTLTWCLCINAKYHAMRRDYVGVAEALREGLPLAREHGFAFWERNFTAYHSVALAAEGRLDELRSVSRRYQKLSDIGFELAQTWFRSAMAEAFGDHGQIKIALGLLAEASALMERNEERYVEPEIHRIRGELVLGQMRASPPTPSETRSAVSAAEQSFLEAIKIARNRNTKIFELRAAISLGRLLAENGRQAEAGKILKQTYDSFTEGFSTPELTTAKVLLNQLGSA